MAFVRPLILKSGNFYQMTDADLDTARGAMLHLYFGSPSVRLDVVSSGGTLGSISDRRYYRSVDNSSTLRYTTTSYARISKVVETTSAPGVKSLPLYWTGSALKAMSITDFIDTFMVQIGGSSFWNYAVYTGSTSGYTQVSTTPIFVDTRSDYTAYGYVTQSNYYLYKKTPSTVSYGDFIFLDGSNNPTAFTTSNKNSAILSAVRYILAQYSGYTLNYAFNNGTQLGTGITNTVLSGGVRVEDTYSFYYRPGGSVVTYNTNTFCGSVV